MTNGEDDLNIAKLKPLLLAGIDKPESALFFLVHVRKIIESRSLTKFRTLKFFCDWAAHPLLTWSGSSLVSDIHHAINNNKNNTDKLIQIVSNTLIKLFREETIEFLKYCKLPINIFFNANSLKLFQQNIFSILEGNHVILNESKIRISSRDHFKTGMWAKEIAIVQSDLGGTAQNKIFCLSVLTSDGITIIIPLTTIHPKFNPIMSAMLIT